MIHLLLATAVFALPAQADDDPQLEALGGVESKKGDRDAKGDKDAKDDKGSKRGKGKKKKKKKGGKKPAGPHWEGEWYAQPVAGALLHSGTGGGTNSAITLGLEGGYRYYQVGGSTPRWQGRTRARGTYAMSNNGNGVDLRLGSFIGPTWQNFGLSVGPDLFWDRYTVGSTTLDPSVGMSLPLTATMPLSSLTLWAGVAPSWLTNEARRVNWDQEEVFGFGHEFTYMAGAAIAVGSFTISANYAYRITVAGPQQGFGLGFKIRP